MEKDNNTSTKGLLDMPQEIIWAVLVYAGPAATGRLMATCHRLFATVVANEDFIWREFYRLRETNPGMTKVEALREAQLSLLRGEHREPAGPNRSIATHE